MSYRLRLAFMGTPAFAVPALKALLNSPHHVVAVYTQPPRPAGRGYAVTPSPVHQLAETNHIPIFHPRSLRSPEEQEHFSKLDLDLAIVAAYGLLLPKAILEAPRFGCLNIHGSLLPRWRGAAPIHYALLSGDQETGITLMRMDQGLDTGPMVSKATLPLGNTSTLSSVHDAMAQLGADLLMRDIDAYVAGTLNPQPQPQEGVTYAPKIEKNLGCLDWSLSATTLQRYVRALTPWPGTFFIHQDTVIKVLKAASGEVNYTAIPGTVLDDNLAIACKQGVFQPLLVQRAGGKPMPPQDFLRGYPILPGTLLSPCPATL